MSAQEASDGAVAARERWFGTLQAHSRDLIAALDDRARVFYVTPAADRMLGFVPDEHLARNMFELIHPDDLDAIAAMLVEGTRRAGTAPSVVFRFQTVTGDWRVLEATLTSCLSDPAIKGFMEDAHDVTEQTNSSRAIRTLGQGNQAMVHAIDEDSLLADTCRINAALGGYRPTWVALHCSRRQVPVVSSTATASTVASSTACPTSPTTRLTMLRGPQPLEEVV